MHSLNTFSMLFTLLISTNAALDGVRIADQARFIQSQLPLPLGTQLPESKDLGIPTSTKISFEATPPVTNPRQCPQTCAARAAAAIGCGSLGNLQCVCGRSAGFKGFSMWCFSASNCDFWASQQVLRDIQVVCDGVRPIMDMFKPTVLTPNLAEIEKYVSTSRNEISMY
ncbi:putative effector protein [Ceratobasidium theobromae]|uniref:Putative effector protein n=1 Tax=Ceratobasidium theobromae TaxID=1582974 RepID=A0A5N5QAI9_9AGAM|nr:putative effector protein [Ceratobasidium theobromae]